MALKKVVPESETVSFESWEETDGTSVVVAEQNVAGETSKNNSGKRKQGQSVGGEHGSMSANRVRSLKQAFDMIDKDQSGYIDIDELKILLDIQGMRVTRAQLEEILFAYGSNGKLGFNEFCHVMGNSAGGSTSEITRAFVRNTAGTLGVLANIGEPEWQRMRREKTEDGIEVKISGTRNARMALGKTIDGPHAQGVILVLILVDVVCVIMELLLVATMCKDPNASKDHHRRFLFSRDLATVPSTAPSPMANGTAPVAYCVACSKVQHDWEYTLHYISVSILFLFAFQIFLLFVSYGLRFFRNPFFVLDAIIIGGAIVLEVGFHVSEGALLVLLLSWRVVRIIHGLVTTMEINHKKTHAKIHKLLSQKQEQTITTMKSIHEKIDSSTALNADVAQLRLLLQSNESKMTEEMVTGSSIEELREYAMGSRKREQEMKELLGKIVDDVRSVQEHVRKIEAKVIDTFHDDQDSDD
eukprot:g3267.t1